MKRTPGVKVKYFRAAMLFAVVVFVLTLDARGQQSEKKSSKRAGFENTEFFRELTVGVASFEAPPEVKVLPIFFVPKGVHAPSDALKTKLIKHLTWSQKRYRELLPQGVTFEIAVKSPQVYWGAHSLEFYQEQIENASIQIVSELLPDLNCNRFNCPYILLVVLMNPKKEFPTPGGRSLNGGFNTGGGYLGLSSLYLEQNPWLQSTLQHELGHSFGLPHVDTYGYDMNTNDSIMSYNPKHHTNHFTPSPTPGKFIPEDLRGLSINTRVFLKLRFDPDEQQLRGYKLAEKIPTIGPMTIPGQPEVPKVTTSSGEDYGSKVTNVIQGEISPNLKREKVTFNSKTMWHSALTTTEWVSIEVVFPGEVELNRIEVHSQHSGQYHAASAMRIAVRETNGQLAQVAESELKSVDAEVTFPKAKGAEWKFEFRAEDRKKVVLRGLRLYSETGELFPPQVPNLPE